jgi:L-lactate dehydrogenase complex protein LldE
VGERPARLLSKVRGIELIPLANVERCCGFGGTFSIKNAEVSTAMLDAKLGDLLATGAEYCTALDNSCLMHVGGALHRRNEGMQTIHIAEILASTQETASEASA